MSTVDPLSTSVQQWLFTPIQLTRTPSQQPSTHSTEHPDDSWTFGNEYQKRREAIMFLMAVQKDLHFHNPVKQQVESWKQQQKAHLQQQGGMSSQNMGGMGMQYGRTNPMQQMGMGMPQHQQQGRYGQNNGMMDQQQQQQQQQQQVVNLEAMSIKDLLAHSGIFGHPNSAEYLHWVNVNQEFEQVAYARDVAYTAASYLQRFFMRRSLRDYKAKEIAVACLYLALKAEERMNIKIRVVARAFKAKLGQANAQTDYFENTIANYEDLVLETLCYDLPIPQPLGYVLRAHTFFYPPSSQLDDTAKLAAAGKDVKEKEKEKKPSVWDEDENSWELSMQKKQMNSRFQQELQRQKREKRMAAEARVKKRQAQEDMRGEELQRAALLDLAYLICDETKTSPICLLSLANYIASASYLLAQCMLLDIPLAEAFDKVDERWLEAFGGKELRLTGEAGVGKFRKTLADTVRWILEIQNVGLMQAVISDWLKAVDVPQIAETPAKPIKEEGKKLELR